ncbi:MAG: tetratricopeptide repeat protein [Pirellulaceae bacterium]|nr:tetratricopeptide repeat protein [Pirellulaceae bacterium]
MAAQRNTLRPLARQKFIKSLIAACAVTTCLTSVGCSSMSGGSGWWSTTGNSVYGASATAAKGVGGAFKTMGATVSSGFGKAKNAVVGTFKPADSAVPGDKEDPTSLASLPGKLSPDLFVMQGALAEGQGQSDKALESYKKALESEPNNVNALVSMARLHDRRGDTQQSVTFFQKAISVNPNDASIHNDLGLAYSKAGNAAAARDSLSKAAAMDPTSVRVRNNLATVLVENGQPEEAVKQLQQVLPPAVAHYNVAYVFATKQNLPAAQQQLQAALQIDPNLQQARDLYARLGGSGAVAGAASAYQTASNIYQSVQGMGQQITATPTSTPSFGTPGTVPASTSSFATPSFSPPSVSLPTATQPPAWVNTPPTMSTTTP